MKRSSCR